LSGVVPEDGLQLGDVEGFVFDVDGTLAKRGSDGVTRPLPGAAAVLERVRASGRPFVLFTNASHVPSSDLARGLREKGLPVGDDELLTPPDSAITYLLRYHRDRPVLLFATDAIRERIGAAGVPLANGEEAGVVLVAHVDEIDIASLERAARAVSAGAPLLTCSYVRGYAGGDGIIFSRGAMVTAAIAKVSGGRPRVVGKPSRAAVAELRTHFGFPTEKLVVVGDDLDMDIALGRLGGSRTVLVRSGMSGSTLLEQVPEHRRPDAAIDSVADLLELL
jgi:HAD superfamily hydrolase (TIGR01450 family)